MTHDIAVRPQVEGKHRRSVAPSDILVDIRTQSLVWRRESYLESQAWRGAKSAVRLRDYTLGEWEPDRFS